MSSDNWGTRLIHNCSANTSRQFLARFLLKGSHCRSRCVR
jgi:hypothetical protein